MSQQEQASSLEDIQVGMRLHYQPPGASRDDTVPAVVLETPRLNRSPHYVLALGEQRVRASWFSLHPTCRRCSRRHGHAGPHRDEAAA
jgi:hypothetical protein